MAEISVEETETASSFDDVKKPKLDTSFVEKKISQILALYSDGKIIQVRISVFQVYNFGLFLASVDFNLALSNNFIK